MRILSLDDHEVFSTGLITALKSRNLNFTIFTECDPKSALKKIQNESFDLLILDLCMPDMDGISFMRAMDSRQIVIPTILLTANNDVIAFKNALELGVMGIISKCISIDELFNTIHAVLEGNIYVAKSILEQLNKVGRFSIDNTDTILTERQIEILNLVEKGLTNEQIGDTLFISVRTVKSHLQSIFKILNVKNRVSCIQKARSLGVTR